VPYGYELAIVDGIKVLVPGPTADVVRLIFKMVADGSTFIEVCRSLDAQGIRTDKGKPAWAERTIGQIIRNPVYRGIVAYKGIPYATCEPLVPSADWLKANQVVTARAQSRGHGTRGRPTGNLLRPKCGGCDAPMYRYGKSYRCAGVGPGGTSAQRRGCGNTI